MTTILDVAIIEREEINKLNLETALEMLFLKAQELRQKGATNIQFDLSHDLFIIYGRPETEEERSLREQQERDFADATEAAERAELDRLIRKYNVK